MDFLNRKVRCSNITRAATFNILFDMLSTPVAFPSSNLIDCVKTLEESINLSLKPTPAFVTDMFQDSRVVVYITDLK